MKKKNILWLNIFKDAGVVTATTAGTAIGASAGLDVGASLYGKILAALKKLDFKKGRSAIVKKGLFSKGVINPETGEFVKLKNYNLSNGASIASAFEGNKIFKPALMTAGGILFSSMSGTFVYCLLGGLRPVVIEDISEKELGDFVDGIFGDDEDEE